MFETGYVFMRDIEALGDGIISNDEVISIMEKHDLVEVQGMKGGIRAFYKRTINPLFGEKKVSPNMNLYLDYFMGSNFQYGCYKGFCALNPLGLITQVCFSMDIYSCLVSEKTCIEVQGAVLTVYPDEGYNPEGVLERMYISALNEFAGCFDDSVEIILDTIRYNGANIDVIKAGLNAKALAWMEG